MLYDPRNHCSSWNSDRPGDLDDPAQREIQGFVWSKPCGVSTVSLLIKCLRNNPLKRFTYASSLAQNLHQRPAVRDIAALDRISLIFSPASQFLALLIGWSAHRCRIYQSRRRKSRFPSHVPYANRNLLMSTEQTLGYLSSLIVSLCCGRTICLAILEQGRSINTVQAVF